jgi:serine/threonine protein kinase
LNEEQEMTGKIRPLPHPQLMLLAPIFHKINIGIIRGMKHIHSFLILHLDLKSLNIMLTADHVPKIIDFGSDYGLIDDSYRVLHQL